MKKKKHDFTHEHSYVMDLLFISILSLGIFFMSGAFNLIKFANNQNHQVLSAQSEVEMGTAAPYYEGDSPRYIPPRPCEGCNK